MLESVEPLSVQVMSDAPTGRYKGLCQESRRGHGFFESIEVKRHVEDRSYNIPRDEKYGACCYCS